MRMETAMSDVVTVTITFGSAEANVLASRRCS
jgi:hypothetical protein